MTILLLTVNVQEHLPAIKNLGEEVIKQAIEKVLQLLNFANQALLVFSIVVVAPLGAHGPQMQLAPVLPHQGLCLANLI